MKIEFSPLNNLSKNVELAREAIKNLLQESGYSIVPFESVYMIELPNYPTSRKGEAITYVKTENGVKALMFNKFNPKQSTELELDSNNLPTGNLQDVKVQGKNKEMYAKDAFENRDFENPQMYLVVIACSKSNVVTGDVVLTNSVPRKFINYHGTTLAVVSHESIEAIIKYEN